MKPKYSFQSDGFLIENYNSARPFSSFLPGIAGEFGKPMWVFYTNRGQVISSFGVRNKNGAMLEFYPANKAYLETSRLGFRTFIRMPGSKGATVYEPFQFTDHPKVQQRLWIRPGEVEVEEVHRGLQLRFRSVVFNAPNEDLPVLVRRLTIENLGRRPISVDVVDGLPQIVPFGLVEGLLKSMSRTMEAFAEVLHVKERLPFFKLKVEPSDRPVMEQIQGGFFSFTLSDGTSCPMIVDPNNVFGADTGLQCPEPFRTQKRIADLPQQTESVTASAFSFVSLRIASKRSAELHSFFGQSDAWDRADSYRRRVIAMPAYFESKRRENTELIDKVTGSFATHSRFPELDAYTAQSYLDNSLRGGQPWILGEGNSAKVFHYYSRKHGDMERDYNAFEVAPTFLSQGNGNFRDVNQNRRPEGLLFPHVGAANIETFFNLIQLDGYNPLVIQFEKFYVAADDLGEFSELLEGPNRDGWHRFLTKPFNPGELLERLLTLTGNRNQSRDLLRRILSKAHKIQDAAHGEGFWSDHWTYNLDLLENFAAVYPDQLKALFVDRRDFTYFDNDHVVQPRHRKYVKRAGGVIRQVHAVVKDSEKAEMIRQRKEAPHFVRTRQGTGPIYTTSLLAKVLGLMAIKASTLDPFGMGIEMEADKPGWCDALNGLPGLLASSVNESFELRRWAHFMLARLDAILGAGDSHKVAVEIAEFLKAVREGLALARPDDFYRTWENLSQLRERFRERVRLGISGNETALSRDEIEVFLKTIIKMLDTNLPKAIRRDGLCTTYFIHDVVESEPIAQTASGLASGEKPPQTVRALKFKQVPVEPFLEGSVHALRVAKDPGQARKLYKAVKDSALYDKKLKMFRLNVPLTRESFEIGRNKIFTPGWLENESIFLHMHYKFLLETLRSGLAAEFFSDMQDGLVAFQDPARYGRSTLENSSFIASSAFPDERLHGGGFVARLTGATAEWLTMVLFMALGSEPFKAGAQGLRFEPSPTLSRDLFTQKADGGFERDTFAVKLFARTWLVYSNPKRRDTFGPGAVRPRSMVVLSADRQETRFTGTLPDPVARQLREGKLERVTIELA